MIYKPHCTVATIVERNGRYLFLEERVRGVLVLNQPSGHLEPEEALIDAAVRETLEETGCAVALTHLVGIYQWKDPASDKAFLRFTFAATLSHHDPNATLDDGIERICWLTRDEVLSQTLPLRSPVILQSLEDYQRSEPCALDLIRWIP